MSGELFVTLLKDYGAGAAVVAAIVYGVLTYDVINFNIHFGRRKKKYKK